MFRPSMFHDQRVYFTTLYYVNSAKLVPTVAAACTNKNHCKSEYLWTSCDGWLWLCHPPWMFYLNHRSTPKSRRLSREDHCSRVSGKTASITLPRYGNSWSDSCHINHVGDTTVAFFLCGAEHPTTLYHVKLRQVLSRTYHRSTNNQQNKSNKSWDVMRPNTNLTHH